MKKLIALALLLPALALAGEDVTALTATVWSYHIKRSSADCEFNPGIGLEHGRNLRGHIGLYSNSDCRLSGFGGFSLTERITGYWHGGAAVLAFTGYHKEKKRDDGGVAREGKVKAAPMLVLAYEGRTRGLNIGFIPGQNALRLIGIKAKEGEDEFKGLLFVQLKLLRW